jgi:hypothetical protein
MDLPNDLKLCLVGLLSRSTNDFDASETIWLIGNEIVENDSDINDDVFDCIKLK